MRTFDIKFDLKSRFYITENIILSHIDKTIIYELKTNNNKTFIAQYPGPSMFTFKTSSFYDVTFVVYTVGGTRSVTINAIKSKCTTFKNNYFSFRHGN